MALSTASKREEAANTSGGAPPRFPREERKLDCAPDFTQTSDPPARSMVFRTRSAMARRSGSLTCFWTVCFREQSLDTNARNIRRKREMLMEIRERKARSDAAGSHQLPDPGFCRGLIRWERLCRERGSPLTRLSPEQAPVLKLRLPCEVAGRPCRQIAQVPVGCYPRPGWRSRSRTIRLRWA